MFGYVRAYGCEKVFDQETYKGVYCSLCKTMGKRYGFKARLLLSYDFAFLATVRMAFSENECHAENSRCSFNPKKKCLSFGSDQEAITLAADATVIMTAYKIKDNISDSSFFKSIAYRLLYLFIRRMYRKAAKNSPEIDEYMREYIDEQTKLEKSNIMNIDLAADPTAKVLSKVLNYKLDDENLARMGYLLGRWIYIIDAVDDLRDDIKSGNYNALKEKYPLNSQDNIQLFKVDATRLLYMTCAELAETCKEIEFKRFEDIINHVISDGLYRSVEKVLSGKGDEDERSIRSARYRTHSQRE